MNTEEHYQEGHTVLHGGDDLEDDFIVEEEETKPTKSIKAKQPSSKSATGTGNDDKNASKETKHKQAPKVVKFFDDLEERIGTWEGIVRRNKTGD